MACSVSHDSPHSRVFLTTSRTALPQILSCRSSAVRTMVEAATSETISFVVKMVVESLEETKDVMTTRENLSSLHWQMPVVGSLGC